MAPESINHTVLGSSEKESTVEADFIMEAEVEVEDDALWSVTRWYYIWLRFTSKDGIPSPVEETHLQCPCWHVREPSTGEGIPSLDGEVVGCMLGFLSGFLGFVTYIFKNVEPSSYYEASYWRHR